MKYIKVLHRPSRIEIFYGLGAGTYYYPEEGKIFVNYIYGIQYAIYSTFHEFLHYIFYQICHKLKIRPFRKGYGFAFEFVRKFTWLDFFDVLVKILIGHAPFVSPDDPYRYSLETKVQGLKLLFSNHPVEYYKGKKTGKEYIVIHWRR